MSKQFCFLSCASNGSDGNEKDISIYQILIDLLNSRSYKKKYIHEPYVAVTKRKYFNAQIS